MDSEKVNYHYTDDLSTNPLPVGTRVLVTGANGYVAHRLIPELLFRGYIVRCMYRNRSSPPILSHPNMEVVYADCLNEEELQSAVENVDYAYYLKGLSLFEPPDGWLDVISGVNPANNDIQPVQEAFSVYQSLISRFPDSRYAAEARKRLIYIINVLAAHEAEVAQYYYAMGADVATVNRARFILETYQNSSSVEDALGVMMLAYKRMGLVELYDDTFRVLELNFPESRYLN